jgi:hypothetical protein
MRFCGFLLTLLLLAAPAHARPITYPDGWSFMTMNDPDMNALHLFYTVEPSYSVGPAYEYMRDSGTHVYAGQLNYLVKRRNNKGSQANLYAIAGAGFATKSGDQDAAGYAGLAADWENRRFFTAYENHALWAGDEEKFVRHKARVGVAPYKGDYGDLHTWLMLQADYDAGEDNSFSVTPLVRVFKGTTLIEAGYNLDGGVLFNAMLTF